MDNGYSLSDLRAATGDGNGFGGNGAWWIVILFLFCFMGGGFWGNRQGEFGQYATAASQQEILFGQQFGQLNDRIANLGNGICNLGYEMQGNIGQLGKEVALGLKDTAALPCMTASVTTAENGIYTLHAETTVYVPVCCNGTPTISAVMSGVAGTVTHVCASVVKLA